MANYRLIKKLPFEASPEVGYISKPSSEKDGVHYWNHNWFEPQDYPEYWEKVVEKDYEILSFIHDGSNGVPEGYIVHMKNGFLDFYGQILPESHYLNSKCWKINSIKCMSDGEVFSVGDKVNRVFVFDDNFNYNTIKSIIIRSNSIWFYVSDYSGLCINSIKKYKEPILTTSDGVEIFEGDKMVYLVHKLSCTTHTNYAKYALGFDKDWIIFSYDRLREQYIDDNKRKYSKKDLIAFYDFTRRHYRWTMDQCVDQFKK